MTKTDVKKRILAENQAAAERLRSRYRDNGTLALNLISSPGTGKTTLLEETARCLAGELRLEALVGDVATEMDAERLCAAGLPARQILTSGACHLDARMVDAMIDETSFPLVDIMFIENVGNLICPTSFDLGEDFKVALLSVTEGDDKPFKYPGIFTKAAMTVITKVDLMPHVPFELDRVCEQIGTLNANANVLTVSSRTGEGLDEWCDVLRAELNLKRQSTGTSVAALA